MSRGEFKLTNLALSSDMIDNKTIADLEEVEGKSIIEKVK